MITIWITFKAFSSAGYSPESFYFIFFHSIPLSSLLLIFRKESPSFSRINCQNCQQFSPLGNSNHIVKSTLSSAHWKELSEPSLADTVNAGILEPQLPLILVQIVSSRSQSPRSQPFPDSWRNWRCSVAESFTLLLWVRARGIGKRVQEPSNQGTPRPGAFKPGTSNQGP